MISVQDCLDTFPGATVVPRVLREYQEELLGKVRNAFETSQRVLAQSPVGSGKTDVAGAMVSGARSRGLRVLFVAHRRELLDNAADRLQLWGIPAADIGIIRADDSRTRPGAPVQIASIQSLSRREAPPADLIIIDEAHRARSTSYMQLLEQYPDAYFVGLTASPLRTDGRGLGEYFGALVTGPQPSALMTMGMLAKPRVYAAPLTVSVSNTIMGTVDELGDVMSAPKLVGNVVEEWKRVAERRSTFCFAASVEHSKSLCERFEAEGVRAVHVDGTTDEKERDQAFYALERGYIDVLCNYGVATEGVDIPRAKCCIMARPTSSLVIWVQSTGRVLRPWNGVTPIILDHGGNTERLGSCVADREWSLDGTARVLNEPNMYHCCLSCFAYSLSTHPCEICGADAPSRQERQIEADESVKLEEVTEDPEALSKRKRVFFERALRRAAHGGYKPTMPPAAYHSEFGGEWPSELAKEAAALFLKDREWQRRYNERLAAQGKKKVPEAWSDE